MAPRVLLIAAAVVLGVAAQDGCTADEEGDGVGLLQSRSEGALDRGDWKPKEEKCAKITDTKCGDGCCPMMSSCKKGKCQKMMGTGTTEPTPTHEACPISYHEVDDGGCCPPATILTKPKKCEPRTCENILMYDCNITASGDPKCTKGGSLTWSEMGDDAPNMEPMPSKEPTVTETCTFGGKTCMTWKIKTEHLTMTGSTYAPDC